MTPCKPVNQFDINGVLIKTHNSIGAAARSVGLSYRTIQKRLLSKKAKPRDGNVFRLVGDHRPIEILVKRVKVKKESIIDFSSGNKKMALYGLLFH